MNSSQNYEIVKSAITNKTSIKAMYHGKLRFLKLSDIEILGSIDEWYTAENHSTTQHCVQEVDAEVEY